MQPSKLNRRQFIRNSGFSVLAGVMVPGFLKNLFAADSDSKKGKKKGAADTGSKKEASKQEPLPAGATAASETEGVGQALGYKADTTQVDNTKYPQHKPTQRCNGCSYYTPVNGSWGRCVLIATGLVNTAGWCTSFNPKSPSKT